MQGRPQPNEFASYYSLYVDRVPGDDVVAVLAAQLDEATAFLSEISEEQSRHRYAPDKWSMRELLGHVNDGERVFMFRAMWFARGFTDPLPSFDQEVAFKVADSDKFPGRVISKSFAQSVPPRSRSAAICLPTPGCAAASRATIPSPCAR